MIGLGKSDKEEKSIEPGRTVLTSLPSLMHTSTDATLEDEEMVNTVLPTPTFFSNLAHQENAEKLISKC